MRLTRKEVKQLFLKIDDILSIDGVYEMVNGNLDTQSTSLYFVKNGKFYDDETYEMCERSYSKEEIEELQRELDKDGLFMAHLYDDERMLILSMVD